jgi:hypothetical protein
MLKKAKDVLSVVQPSRSDRLHITPTMLEKAKGKFRKIYVQEKSDSSPSPHPKTREDIFVSCVNFQFDDSRGVSFLEIGRNNTNIVEVVNVTNLASQSTVIESEKNEMFSARRDVITTLTRQLFAPPAYNNKKVKPVAIPGKGSSGRMTPEGFMSAIQRLPISTIGSVPERHDSDWQTTLDARLNENKISDDEPDSEANERKKEDENWRIRFKEAELKAKLELIRELELELQRELQREPEGELTRQLQRERELELKVKQKLEENLELIRKLQREIEREPEGKQKLELKRKLELELKRELGPELKRELELKGERELESQPSQSKGGNRRRTRRKNRRNK